MSILEIATSFIIICGMVIFMKFLGVPSDSVAVDTYVKYPPRISISQIIDKVACFFHFAFVSTFGISIIRIPSMPLFHDIDLAL